MTAPRPLIRGERVLLRHPSLRDADEFLARVRASRKLHARWVFPQPDSEVAFTEYLNWSRRKANESLLVCRDGDGAIAGVYNLSQILYRAFCSANLSYFAFEPFAGQGYMKDGLELVLRRAFRDLGLHRLEANIQPGNARSIKLVNGAGFRLEGYSPRYLKVGGRWRDHERWAITVEDRRAGAV